MTDKIAADVCEKEFVRMCESRRIEHDNTKMTKLEIALFESRKKPILRAMARGTLIMNKDGNPEFTPADGKPITFHRATGATLMAGDGFGPNDDVTRVAAVATEMTKSVPGKLAELDVEDFRVVHHLTNFFLTPS